MRAELAMRPFDVVDAQAFALAGGRGVVLCIVENSSPQIGLLDNLGVLDTYRLQDLFPCKDSVGPVAIDVESGYVET
jgi:hypothetical protein